jgi:hypothetical protein
MNWALLPKNSKVVGELIFIHVLPLLGWEISRLQSPYYNKRTDKNTGKHLLLD